jgi:hypothetical protein
MMEIEVPPTVIYDQAGITRAVALISELVAGGGLSVKKAAV